MKHLSPFRSAPEALQAFDNGGYFFNLFSHSKDGVVSPAELTKAAGTPLNRQAALLFLDLSISRLDQQGKDRVLSRLDQDLFDQYQKSKAIEISSPADWSVSKANKNAILTGVPKKVGEDSKFGGFIMVPIMVSSVTTFTMIPIQSSYEVYEVVLSGGGSVMVAHEKESGALPEKALLLGGVIKTCSASADEDQGDLIYLEVQFYTESD
jgi:hypothetical protein